MIADIGAEPTTDHLKLNCGGSDMKGHHISEALELNVGLILRPSCGINKLRLSDFAKVTGTDSPKADFKSFRHPRFYKEGDVFTWD